MRRSRTAYIYRIEKDEYVFHAPRPARRQAGRFFPSPCAIIGGNMDTPDAPGDIDMMTIGQALRYRTKGERKIWEPIRASGHSAPKSSHTKSARSRLGKSADLYMRTRRAGRWAVRWTEWASSPSSSAVTCSSTRCAACSSRATESSHWYLSPRTSKSSRRRSSPKSCTSRGLMTSRRSSGR